MAKGSKFASLDARMVKRTMAVPHKIINPDGSTTVGWIAKEAA